MAEHEVTRTGLFFINKVIEENDVKAFSRHNIKKEDFLRKEEQEVYEYIVDYARNNDGNAPSYALLADTFDHFEYVPDVTESYSFLATDIKDIRGKALLFQMFETGEFEDNLNEKGIHDFVRWATNAFEDIGNQIDMKQKVGKSIKKDGDTYLSEYYAIKGGKSNRVIPSAFRAIGQYETGNSYVIYGKSGRGKSVIALLEAVVAAIAGHTVLYWGMELNWYQIMSRLYALLSGEYGLVKQRALPTHRLYADSDGNITGGFNPRDLQRARLDEPTEEHFETMLKNLNSVLEGDIIIRAVDDPEFTDRSVANLESDIVATGADLVIVDPFYYMDYEANTSRKTGGDAEATSKKLKMLTGQHEVAIISLTQAEEDVNEIDEEGFRELVLPERKDVKKSMSLLHDASMLIAIDTNYKEGVGIVGINKGRDGGEGNISNIIFLPQYGLVKEADTGIGALEDFDNI